MRIPRTDHLVYAQFRQLHAQIWYAEFLYVIIRVDYFPVHHLHKRPFDGIIHPLIDFWPYTLYFMILNIND
jgi:hypothetical protein